MAEGVPVVGFGESPAITSDALRSGTVYQAMDQQTGELLAVKEALHRKKQERVTSHMTNYMMSLSVISCFVLLASVAMMSCIATCRW